MTGKIGSQPAPVATTKTPAAPVVKAKEAPTQKKASSNYTQPAKKGPVKLTGTGAFPKVALKADPALAKLAGRAAGYLLGDSTKAKAEVNAALKNIGKPDADSAKQAARVSEEFKKLSPDQRVQVWKSLFAATREAVLKELEKPGSTVSPSIALAQVQSMSPAELKAAAASMREGVKGDAMKLAISSELVARSDWGGKHKDVVTQMRTLIADGTMKFESGRGMGRTSTDGSVKLDPDLAASPQALAATMAHEATHSVNAVSWDGMNKSVFVEEAAGNLASGQVWAELGDAKDPKMSEERLYTLNAYAEASKAKPSGENAVKARMVAEYAKEASTRSANHQEAFNKDVQLNKKGELTNKPLSTEQKLKYSEIIKEETAKVNDLVAQLKASPETVKLMKAEDALEVARAVLKTSDKTADVESLAKTLADLPADVRKAVHAQLPAFAKTGPLKSLKD